MELSDFLPEWSSEPLGNLVDISTGKTPSRSNSAFWDGGTNKWAKISDLVFGEFLFETQEHITESAIKAVRPHKVKKGTLLFSFKLTLGKMAFAGCELYTNEAIAALELKTKRVDKKFLFYALQVANLTENVGEAAKGLTLNKKTIPLINVTFPQEISEQRRIINRIESLTEKVELIRNIAVERELKLDTLLQALYTRMIEKADRKPLKKVASLVRRKIDTNPDELYEEMGVRSFGKGTFKKPILTGEQIDKKRIYHIHEGDLVFSNVFAWERAIAVAKAEDQGRVGSHRFITYVPHDKTATSHFLCHHFLSKQGIEDIRAASPGSAGRNRTLGLKKLAEIKVPVPEYRQQKLFAEIAKRRELIQRYTAEIEKEAKIFTAALIAKAFRGEL